MIQKLKNMSIDKIVILCIVMSAIFLNFSQISSMEINSDFALYSVRSLGWFDYVASEGQTSPVQWWGKNPWWGNLSFHDHPPLVFAFQHISFLLFGENHFAARMPFATAGVGLTLISYYFLKKLHDKNTAILGALMMAISSHILWVGKSGYLEGIQIFFITLSIFIFLLFLKTNEKKYLYLWGGATGCALLSKYTALFLLPSVFFYLINRKVLVKSLHFYCSLLIIIAVVSPAIIYNIMMYYTRSHFDASLSILTGNVPDDFSAFQKEKEFHFFKNFYSVIKTFLLNTSFSYIFLYSSAILFLFTEFVQKKIDHQKIFIIINLIFLFTMLVFGNAQSHHITLLQPFLIILSSFAIVEFFQKIKKKKIIKKFFIGILFAIFSFELFFNFNTNILIKPAVNNSHFFSPFRFYNQGFIEMEKFFKKNIFSGLIIKRKNPPIKKQGLDVNLFDRDFLIIVDDRMNWFSSFWYLQRYTMYYNIPAVTFVGLSSIMQENNIPLSDMLKVIKSFRAKKYVFIFVEKRGFMRNNLPLTTKTWKV